MSMLRPIAAALAAVALLAAVGSAEPKTKGDSRVLIQDSATRQAQLKRSFESFRQKLAVLAGRYENSSSEKDRDRAKALRRALKLVGDSGVEFKFDSLITGLARKGADKNVDVLGQVLRDNKELRQDLQKILVLLTEDDRGKRLADRNKNATRLLEQLKDLRNKQARLQAMNERGKHKPADLAKPQEKLAGETGKVLPTANPEDKDKDKDTDPVEAVRKPVEEAVKEEEKAGKQLAGGNGSGAGESQGKAVSKLDEAIRRLRDIIRQTRKEERERALSALIARCKKMLALQTEILEGTEQIARELRRSEAGKPSLAQAARSNKLADKQEESLKEADSALKMIKDEGTAVAFAEVFEQVRDDMLTVKNRLLRADTGRVTQAIEVDLVETIKEIIRALEKEKKDNDDDKPPQPPEGGPPGKPEFVNLLQQLKMVYSMQRRVHDRTELYGKRYQGEQAPTPQSAGNPKERQKYERIEKELKDLAGRQERIGKVTREIMKQDDSLGARRID